MKLNIADIFKALSDKTRVKIVIELAKKGSLQSGQIADMFETSWPTISRHLAVLKNSDIISEKKIGQQVFYSLNTGCFLETKEFIQQVSDQKQKKSSR